MVTQGAFETSKYAGVRGLKFNWSLSSQSVEGNYSKINWVFLGYGNGNSWYYTSNGYLNINNNRVWTQGGNKIRLSNGTVIATGVATIYHNNDGTGSFGADGGATIYSHSAWQSGSGSWQLPTIARASQPSCITSPQTTNIIGNLGDEITIHMNRHAPSFTHTVKYSWFNKSEVIATNVSNNCNWIIPKNFAENIPTATSGWGTIIVDTYNGNIKIGTKTVIFTVNVPNSPEFQPKIINVKLQEVASLPNTFDFYIQNLSKIKGIITAVGSYNSTIASYSTTINNETFTTNSWTTSVLSLINPKLKVIVRDSRGRTTTYETTIQSKKYIPPVINNFNSYRNTTNPQKIDLVFSSTIYKLNNINQYNFKFHYKKITEEQYKTINVNPINITTKDSGDTKIYTANYSILDSDPNASYISYLEVLDSFNNVISTKNSINTIFKLINISNNKKNISIGKLHEKNGYNEVALPTIFYKKVYKEEPNYKGVFLSSPDIDEGKIIFNHQNNSLEIKIQNKKYKITLTEI